MTTYLLAAKRSNSMKSCDCSLVSLMASVAKPILQKYSVPIDALIVSSQSTIGLGNQGLIACELADRLSLHGIPALRVDTASSAFGAVKLADDLIQSGNYQNILVVGGETMSSPHLDKTTRRQMIGAVLPEEDRHYGLTMPAAIALIAQYVKNVSGISSSDWEQLLRDISLRCLRHAAQNPNSQHFYSKTLQDFQNHYNHPDQNPWVNYPLRRLDCCPTADGAGALLFSKHKQQRGRDGQYYEATTKLSGIGLANDYNAITQRADLSYLRATRQAAQKAYTAASIDPMQDFTREQGVFVELHDPFSPLFILNAIDLGIVPTLARFSELFYSGGFDASSHHEGIPINLSGGIRDGHPLGATGIMKLVDCHQQLLGEFKGVTPAIAKTAICQSIGGPGTLVGVAVLDHISVRRQPQREPSTFFSLEQTSQYPPSPFSRENSHPVVMLSATWTDESDMALLIVEDQENDKRRQFAVISKKELLKRSITATQTSEEKLKGIISYKASEKKWHFRFQDSV